MVDDATANEGTKLLVDEARDAETVLRAGPCLREERLEILSHHFVQHGLLREARDVPWCERSGSHNRIPRT